MGRDGIHNRPVERQVIFGFTAHSPAVASRFPACHTGALISTASPNLQSVQVDDGDGGPVPALATRAHCPAAGFPAQAPCARAAPTPPPFVGGPSGWWISGQGRRSHGGRVSQFSRRGRFQGVACPAGWGGSPPHPAQYRATSMLTSAYSVVGVGVADVRCFRATVAGRVIAVPTLREAQVSPCVRVVRVAFLRCRGRES